MSVVGDAIFAALSADSTINSMVGTRIYPNRIPQGPRPVNFTAVVYQVISDIPANAITGSAADRLRNARVQIDCYAKRYEDGQALADAVDAVVTTNQALRGWRDLSRDFFENDEELHRVSMDVFVWL
jgi:hypothetical protein